MADPRRLLEIGRNLVLTAGSATRMAAHDPVLLAVQSARRVPAGLRGPLVRAVQWRTAGAPSVRGAFGEFLADRPEGAVNLLAASPTPRSRAGRTLAAELAVHLGRPEAVPGGLDQADPGTQARAARRVGDFSGAIAHAAQPGASRYQLERLTAERAVLLPGFRLQPVRLPPPHPQTPHPTGPRALHLLTNSLPHTRSGYSFRSHSVLQGQLRAGIRAEAVTRIGYPVTVGLPLARATEEVDGVAYHRLLPTRLVRTPAGRMQQMVEAVAAIAADFTPSVLHTTTDCTNALVVEALARFLGVPWVYEVRGQMEKTWVASLPPRDREAARSSERFALLRDKETEMMLAADHVVTLSETLRADILARGVPPERITVITNAVAEEQLEMVMEPAEARAALGLPAEGFWVGTISSLVDYEGLDTLLDAVAQLRSQGADVRVALVGDGVSRPALLARAAALGLGEAALLPGRVPAEAAVTWHRALDAFVVPRRDLEVCRVVTPLKPIEAMAAGRPVIASDLPALREIVGVPGSGVLVPPGDVSALAAAIAELASNQSERDAYGERGRAFAATRTWTANGALYRRIYQELEARQ